ncbi:hypothetical protein [Streptomyces sp. NPDC023588]|uniref:hypothetical protein n=1 Tax=Streptomyces sp. NPDC023588 TaxID=3154907 RepID=UPI003408B084
MSDRHTVSSARVAVDQLVACARAAPRELVSMLVDSDDVGTARLGQAIRDVQDTPDEPPQAPESARDRPHGIDPVTHDPAW